MDHESARRAIVAAKYDKLTGEVDLLPRLAYADWLMEEGGDPERGEFIHLQCKIHTKGRAKEYECTCGFHSSTDLNNTVHGNHCPSLEYVKDYIRQRDLVKDKGIEWSDGLFIKSPYSKISLITPNCYFEIEESRNTFPCRIGYKRGFIEHIALEWDVFIVMEREILTLPIRLVTFLDEPRVLPSYVDIGDDQVRSEAILVELQRRWPRFLFDLAYLHRNMHGRYIGIHDHHFSYNATDRQRIEAALRHPTSLDMMRTIRVDPNNIRDWHWVEQELEAGNTRSIITHICPRHQTLGTTTTFRRIPITDVFLTRLVIANYNNHPANAQIFIGQCQECRTIFCTHPRIITP